MRRWLDLASNLVLPPDNWRKPATVGTRKQQQELQNRTVDAVLKYVYVEFSDESGCLGVVGLMVGTGAAVAGCIRLVSVGRPCFVCLAGA